MLNEIKCPTLPTKVELLADLARLRLLLEVNDAPPGVRDFAQLNDWICKFTTGLSTWAEVHKKEIFIKRSLIPGQQQRLHSTSINIERINSKTACIVAALAVVACSKPKNPQTHGSLYCAAESVSASRASYFTSLSMNQFTTSRKVSMCSTALRVVDPVVTDDVVQAATMLKREKFIVKTLEQEAYDENLLVQMKRKKKIATVLILAALYNVAIVPLRCGGFLPWSWWFIIFDTFSDMILLMYLIQSAITPNQFGISNKQFSVSRLDCVQCFSFVAVAPLQFVGLFIESGTYTGWWRFNKMLLAALMHSQSQIVFSDWSIYASRYLGSVFLVVTFLHLFATGFHIMSINLVDTKDVYALIGQDFTNGTMRGLHRYLYCFWYTMTMACGYNSLWPRVDEHVLYAVVVSIPGLAVYATCIAAVTSRLESATTQETVFRDKMDKVTGFLSYMQLPASFQSEVKTYFKHLHAVSRSEQLNDDLFDDLPKELFDDLTFAVNYNLIRNIPLFKYVDNEDFVMELVSSLELEVVFPGAVVVLQGTEGNDLYFVVKGELNVEILDPSGMLATVCVLNDGAFFGEVSLIFGGVRNASVRAVTYSTLYMLKGTVFKQVLDNPLYEKCLNTILHTAQERLGLSARNSVTENGETDNTISELPSFESSSMTSMTSNTTGSVFNVGRFHNFKSSTNPLARKKSTDFDTQSVTDQVINGRDSGQMDNTIAMKTLRNRKYTMDQSIVQHNAKMDRAYGNYRPCATSSSASWRQPIVKSSDPSNSRPSAGSSVIFSDLNKN